MESISSLVDGLLAKGIGDGAVVRPLIKRLHMILRDSSGDVPCDDLRKVLRLPDELEYKVTLSEKGQGCWEGTSFRRESRECESLAHIIQLARQELRFRGEPEEQTEERLSPDEADAERALSSWKRKTMLRGITGQKKLLVSARQMDSEKALKLVLGAVQSPSAEVRIEAVKMAFALSPVSLQVLRIAAEDEDPRVRFNAVIVLKNAGGPEAAKLLGRLARRTADRQVKIEAVRALGTIRHPESALALSGLYMKTSSLVLKREILQAAGKTGGSISVQLLTGALADDNPEVMGEALGALAPYGRAILHDAMAAAMKRCSGVALQRNIAEAGRWKDPGVVDILGPYVQDGDPSVRLAVAIALKENGTPGAVPLLAELLNDPVAEVRNGALSRITGIPWGYCGDALRDTLNHPDIEMARMAARKLCEIYDGAVVPILESALEHSDPEVRFVAAEGLLKGKSPRGVPAMEELIRQGVFSSDGVKALRDHGGEEGLEALLRYMPEAPPQHRNIVIQVFSTQRCQKAVPFLADYFGKATGSERINTAKALEFQGWKPKNLEQAREFFRLIGNNEVLAEMGAPEAVQPLLQRAMRTTSDQELITCCRLLARNENSSATNALVSLLKAKKWNQAIYPAQQLIRMDTLGALQGLVDHIFGPSPVHSVEREAVSKAGGGIVRLILNRTRNSLSAEKAVKLLSEILRNRPSIVSHADLVSIASLSVSAVVMKTTEEACTVVLKRTNQVKPLNCDEVKRLAAEELAARKTNG